MRSDLSKQAIKDLEQEVQRKHGVEVSVYGTGNQGLQQLNNYLYSDGEQNKETEKRSLEYAVYLSTILTSDSISPLWGDENKILYAPSRGSNSQTADVEGIFVEPALPRYDASEYWSQYGQNYTHLLKPNTDGRPKNHVKPDLLLTDPSEKKLPWGADIRPQITDEGKLKRWVAHGEFDKVQEILRLDERPDSAAGWYSAIAKHGDVEGTSEMFDKWKSFKPKVNYLIEVKHQDLSETDYSQILWYALVYGVPVVIVSMASIGDRSFLRDLDDLPVDTRVIDQIQSVGDVQNAFSQLTDGWMNS